MLVQLQAHDLPMVGQMNTSLYLLFKAIKPQATVTLSGEGADEIFSGYPWLHMEPALKAQTFPWLPAFHGVGENPLAWVSLDTLRKTNPQQHIGQRYRETLAEVPRLEGEDELAARRREMAYVDLTYWLPFLLERKDRMGMAASLEVRHPFADHRLVQYSWNIPWEIKMVDSIEKGVLRRAFADVLPEDVRSRKKSAYPNVRNPAYDEATRSWTGRILDDPNAPIQPLINSAVVRAAVDSNGTGRTGFAQVSLFERIIMLNEWLEQYQVTLAL
jgi:asparagine synthase (glutamine-hydrolysing)